MPRFESKPTRADKNAKARAEKRAAKKEDKGLDTDKIEIKKYKKIERKDGKTVETWVNARGEKVEKISWTEGENVQISETRTFHKDGRVSGTRSTYDPEGNTELWRETETWKDHYEEIREYEEHVTRVVEVVKPDAPMPDDLLDVEFPMENMTPDERKEYENYLRYEARVAEEVSDLHNQGLFNKFLSWRWRRDSSKEEVTSVEEGEPEKERKIKWKGNRLKQAAVGAFMLITSVLPGFKAEASTEVYNLRDVATDVDKAPAPEAQTETLHITIPGERTVSEITEAVSFAERESKPTQFGGMLEMQYARMYKIPEASPDVAIENLDDITSQIEAAIEQQMADFMAEIPEGKQAKGTFVIDLSTQGGFDRTGDLQKNIALAVQRGDVAGQEIAEYFGKYLANRGLDDTFSIVLNVDAQGVSTAGKGLSLKEQRQTKVDGSVNKAA
jgi:hypothetical protein